MRGNSTERSKQDHRERANLAGLYPVRKPPATLGVAPDLRFLSRGGIEPAVRLEVLEAMLEGAREGLCIMDPQSVLLHSNRAAGELLGFEPAQVAGRPVREVGVELGFDWSIGRDVGLSRVTVSTIQTLRTGKKLLVSGVPISAANNGLSYIVVTIREVTGMGQVMSRLRDAIGSAELPRAGMVRTGDCKLRVDDVVADSPVLAGVRDTALQYARADSTVLVLGETGAGKGLFARLIHQASARGGEPFLEVNCGAIPETLMEAELFGYVKGAFTGADPRGKIGLIELAHKGTLLLNEIGDLPLGLQVKLLRFLEDGEVWAVGAVKAKRPDVRIIAATNRDLQGMIAAGTFRRDMFYRLNVLCLEIPPLRAHADDIPRLIELTLSRLERAVGRRLTVTPAALRALSRYPFPGNVRELLNLVERLMVTTTSDTIDVADLPSGLLAQTGPGSPPGPDGVSTLRETLESVECQLVRDALARYKTQALAAKHLGVTQSTVARKVKQYRLENHAP